MFDTVNYTFSGLNTYSNKTDLQVTFPCAAANRCAAAFTATFASFYITFTDTNAISTDTISILLIDQFNRLSCFSNQVLVFNET